MGNVVTAVHAVTPDRFGDVVDLFETNGATRGCYCMGLIVSRAEVQTGWGAGNMARLQSLTSDANPPVGLLAYAEDTPVGWCALGPRTRYPRAVGSRGTIFKDRDKSEDDDVWLVPCFFIRVGFRRVGATEKLLTAAVDLARARGVKAVEGWPLADAYESQESFEGREHVFAKCGFTRVAQPSPRRVVMRLDL